MNAVLFYIFAALSAVGALGVVISRNIVRTAVFLLFALLGAAGLYLLLDAEFLSAVQLVIYAGGTLILIVFGVMLTSKSPFVKFEAKPLEIIAGGVMAAVLMAALVAGIFSSRFVIANESPSEYPMLRLGQALLGDYLVPFELISVLLLVVMIGAAYLAKGRRERRVSR